MLPTYDAPAIADIMGLSFVRQTVRSDRDVVIRVADETMRVIGPKRGERRTTASSSGSRTPSPAFIERAVAGGLPRHALRHVAEALAGDDATRASSLEWSVVPKTTLDRRTKQLSAAESERTERIARLFVHARRALGTVQEAREFMMAPHPELDGRSPFEMAFTDLGTRHAERILTALEYGLAL